MPWPRIRVDRIRFVALPVLTVGLMTLGASMSASAKELAAVGQVVQQHGVVTALREGTPRALRLGASIYTGDKVITRANAKVAIEFRDGSTLSVGSDTKVTVSEYAPEGRKRGILTLLLGIIRTHLSEIWQDGFDVRARAAVASVRSTDWVTEAREDRSSVFVVAGTVAVRGVADGAEVVLGEGFGTDVETGGAPSQPKKWGSSRVEQVLARTRLP